MRHKDLQKELAFMAKLQELSDTELETALAETAHVKLSPNEETIEYYLAVELGRRNALSNYKSLI